MKPIAFTRTARRTPHWRSIGLGLLALQCLVLTGCVSESAVDNTFYYRYQIWMPVLVFLGGLLSIPIGIFLAATRLRRFGWVLLIGGPIATFCFAPNLLLESVTVGDQGFAVRSGFWGMTASQDLSFHDIRQMQVVQEKTRGRNSRIVDTLVCSLGNGAEVRIQLNNDVKVMAGPMILQRAAANGVRVMGH